MGKKRKSYSPSFKAKVALAAIRQEKTLSQLSAQFKVHPVAIARWKAHLLDQAAEVFIDGRTQKPSDDPTVEEFDQEIGRLKIELDGVKKNLKHSSENNHHSTERKRHAIDPDHPQLSRVRQCQLLHLPRSTYYYEPVAATPEELALMARTDATSATISRFHFEHPSFGSRRLAKPFGISRDKSQRLMQDLHLAATYPKRRTTIANRVKVFEAYNKSNRRDENFFVLEKSLLMTEGRNRMKESHLALKKTTSMADKIMEVKRWLRWSR